MLKVQASPRKVKWVELIEDTAPNVGGFYCKVYDDESGEFPCEDDNFTISRYSIPNTIQGVERRKKAMIIANDKLKQKYNKAKYQ